MTTKVLTGSHLDAVTYSVALIVMDPKKSSLRMGINFLIAGDGSISVEGDVMACFEAFVEKYECLNMNIVKNPCSKMNSSEGPPKILKPRREVNLASAEAAVEFIPDSQFTMAPVFTDLERVV